MSSYLTLKYNSEFKNEYEEYNNLIQKYNNKKQQLLKLFNTTLQSTNEKLSKINRKLLFENKQLCKNMKIKTSIEKQILDFKEKEKEKKNKIKDNSKDLHNNKIPIFLFLNNNNNNLLSYKINTYIKSFIIILYENKIIKTNYNLVSYSHIKKQLFNYKQYYLNEITINTKKNKHFNNKIKLIDLEIDNLLKERAKLLKYVKQNRVEKIQYYKNMNSDFYNKLLDKTIINLEEDLLLINKFHFFDSNDIYELIKNIKLLERTIEKFKNEKKEIIIDKKYYNSNIITTFLSSIKKRDKHLSIYKLMDGKIKVMNNKMKQINKIKYVYPIIIQNESKFMEFIYLLNSQVFYKQTVSIINKNKENIKYLNNSKIKLEQFINELKQILFYKKHNFILYNNYNYYQHKLYEFEKSKLINNR